jgi:hypothetical protein
MKIKQPRHSTDPTRTAQSRNEYMTNYMRDRRRSRRQSATRAVASRLPGIHFGYYDVGCRTLRDNKTLMYPERVTGENWQPGKAMAEVNAALARHDRHTN